ncbi:MAG: orotidine-5'-phosphate decarboxylase [Chlamydiales bacterium]|nr:orotidine-5'-phosphate decarboxylase [Chlamydiia bacterium]MCP5508352.1 orotidine-5'-phosphate decarboxylase [Chlamydiales bacterium]
MLQETLKLTYSQRIPFCSNLVGRKLLQIVEDKQSNLSVAADVTKKSDLLALARKLGPKICMLKTHIDIVDDFDLHLLLELQQIAKEENFFLFEDRKFADIGATVEAQYGGGIYKIAQWAHLTNAHIIPGPGIVDGLKKIGKPLHRGLLLLAQMSSSGTTATGPYTQACLRLAQKHTDFVTGFISQGKITNEPYFIHMTPGVNLGTTSDSLGQRYSTPEYIIGEKESDIIIVGRGITQAQNPEQEAERYRSTAWDAYKQRLK